MCAVEPKVCKQCGTTGPFDKRYNRKICNPCKNKNDYTRRDFITELLHDCRKRSIIKNIDFDISRDDILLLKQNQNNKCKYWIGRDLEWCKNAGKYKASIDRIDSNLGYIKTNIQLVCYQINIFKGNLEHCDFVECVNDNIFVSV